MISCFRRLPHFISNNVRTFFCDTSKAAPLDAKWLENVVKHHKHGTTTNGSKYRTVRVRDNVRVFLITDSKIEREEMVFCSIQIGVGSVEDPDDCLGLAHLLEHVVSYIACVSKIFSFYIGETFPVRTVYTFKPTTANCAEALREWSKLLFSESDLESLNSMSMKIMESQRDVVDNEWRESAYGSPRDMHHIVEILREEGMDTSKFRFGNNQTLQQTDDDQQMNYLNQLRRRYRERPVDVFIYSKAKLKMETILKALNADDFLQKGQAMEAQPIDWKKRHQTAIDLNKHLFVVKSDYDWQQLVIVFPLNEHISHKEVNTFDFISKMIESTADGSLGRYLISNNWATYCGAVDELNLYAINVRLTNEGLEKIQTVEKAVQSYLKFLQHNWETLDEFEYRKQWADNALEELEGKTPEQYIHYIGSKYDIKTDEFDENHLIQTLDRDEAQQFISDHFLNNETIVRMILSRDPEGLVKTLVQKCRRSLPKFTSLKDMNERKDKIFNIQFYIRDVSTFFTENEEPSNKFDLPDLRQIKTVTGHIPLEAALIIKPDDTSYQTLLITHLRLQCAKFWSPFDKGFFNVPFQTPFCAARVEKASDILNKSKNFKIEDDKKFQLSKHHLMCEQSRIMITSVDFARSLLETAAANFLTNRKIEPIPMQYKALSTMTLSEYDRHAAALKKNPDFKKVCEEGLKVINNDDKLEKEYLIEAINRNELLTVTLFFCVTEKKEFESMEEEMTRCLRRCCWDIRKKRNMYTVVCDVSEFAGVRGIFVQILSVACKANQTNDEIIKLLDVTMKESLRHKIRAAELQDKLKPLYTHMLKRKIIVQIKGHTSCRGNDSDFKTQFDAWYEDHEPMFRKIVA